MFVVVAFVFGVAMAVMQVVHVVAVLHRFVGAVGSAVLVLGRSMFGRVVMFVVMAVVFGVTVAVVQVVHMVAVLHGFVCAVCSAVLVLGETVFGVNFLGHLRLPVMLVRWGSLGPGLLLGGISHRG